MFVFALAMEGLRRIADGFAFTRIAGEPKRAFIDPFAGLSRGFISRNQALVPVIGGITGLSGTGTVLGQNVAGDGVGLRLLFTGRYAHTDRLSERFCAHPLAGFLAGWSGLIHCAGLSTELLSLVCDAGEARGATVDALASVVLLARLLNIQAVGRSVVFQIAGFARRATVGRVQDITVGLRSATDGGLSGYTWQLLAGGVVSTIWVVHAKRATLAINAHPFLTQNPCREITRVAEGGLTCRLALNPFKLPFKYQSADLTVRAS